MGLNPRLASLSAAIGLVTVLSAGAASKPALSQSIRPSQDEAPGPEQLTSGLCRSGQADSAPPPYCRTERKRADFDVDSRAAHRFEKEQELQIKRYREARGDLPETGGAYALDGEFPGLNCTIFRIPGLHLCGTESRGGQTR